MNTVRAGAIAGATVTRFRRYRRSWKLREWAMAADDESFLCYSLCPQRVAPSRIVCVIVAQYLWMSSGKVGEVRAKQECFHVNSTKDSHFLFQQRGYFLTCKYEYFYKCGLSRTKTRKKQARRLRTTCAAILTATTSSQFTRS